jgi:hypothetical protein
VMASSGWRGMPWGLATTRMVVVAVGTVEPDLEMVTALGGDGGSGVAGGAEVAGVAVSFAGSELLAR